MGLFTKKAPCAICGGKVKGLFASRIDGQYVCKECYGWVDLPDGTEENMSLAEFNAYRAFRAENDQLKQQFQITQKIDFGWFDTKFVFDSDKRLMCLDDSLRKTVYQGEQIKAFVIKEDDRPIFEGSAAGLMRYLSPVPDQVRTLEPQLELFRLQAEMNSQLEDGDRLRVNVPEPFAKFNVELRFDHPYWDVFTADMSGPGFDDDHPNGNDYIKKYRECFAAMEQLAMALKQAAFPDAPEQTVQGGGAGKAAAPVDAVAEIKRFKDLLDQGLITEEEFTAKKKHLLGI